VGPGTGSVAGLGMSRPVSLWTGRRVLITGHSGFKGAWLGLWLERLGADVSGLSLPPEDDGGAFAAFQPWSTIDSHFADLRDRSTVEKIMAETGPEVVFHLGAQALVARGWSDPVGTYEVNVVGTANLLEAVSRTGSVKAVVVVTSDKVYADAGGSGPFTEHDALGGSDPYSASKAGAEFVVRAWRNANPTIPVTTVRAGNVIGGGDVAEHRLVPDAWRALRAGEDLVLRDSGATRPWQFVLDPLAGYLGVSELLLSDARRCPPALNFGPALSGCWPVGHVADAILAAWGAGRWRDGRQPGDPVEAQALTLDSALAWRTLGWQPRLELATAIGWTVEWWRAAAAGAPLRALAIRQLDRYEELGRAA
jgi:CDP-glucose 4,6-dehydratase